MICLIDKSIQFCNTGNKYVVAIICTFGRRLRMSTMGAVPTCTANMPVCATLRKICNLFLEEKYSQQCLLVCLESSF